MAEPVELINFLEAGLTPLQIIESKNMQENIINLYATQGKAEIAQALRNSLAEAPNTCCVM